VQVGDVGRRRRGPALVEVLLEDADAAAEQDDRQVVRVVRAALHAARERDDAVVSPPQSNGGRAIDGLVLIIGP